MRVLLEGGTGGCRAAVAAALRRGGCDLAAAADEAHDCRLVLHDNAAAEPAVDTIRGTVSVDGRRMRLTRIELAILLHLSRASAPVPRAALLAAIWGYGFDPGTNLVAVHVSRLRAKLGSGRLEHRDGGYRLATPVQVR